MSCRSFIASSVAGAIEPPLSSFLFHPAFRTTASGGAWRFRSESDRKAGEMNPMLRSQRSAGYWRGCKARRHHQPPLLCRSPDLRGGPMAAAPPRRRMLDSAGSATGPIQARSLLLLARRRKRSARIAWCPHLVSMALDVLVKLRDQEMVTLGPRFDHRRHPSRLRPTAGPGVAGFIAIFRRDLGTRQLAFPRGAFRPPAFRRLTL